MFTKETLEKIAKRQAELTTLVLANKATDENKAELGRLNKAVNATSDAATTEHKAMKLSEAKVAIEEMSQKIDPSGEVDKDFVALIKRNISVLAALKDVDGVTGDTIVTIEVLSKGSDDDRFKAMEDKIKELEASLKAFDGRTTSGLDNNDDPDNNDDLDGDDAAKKAKAGAAQALGIEAIDALVKRFQGLKAKMDNGSLTNQDIRDAWTGEWELKSLIEGAAAVMAKMDEAKKEIETVMPAMEKLQKEIDGEGEGDGKGGGEGDDPDNPGEPGNGEGGSTEKGDQDNGDSRDLAPKFKSGTEMYRQMKSGRLNS